MARLGRSGKGEEAALEALAAYLPRYAVVTARAGLELPDGAADDVEIVERLPGSGATDFGALGNPPAVDAEPIPAEEAARQAALVEAASAPSWLAALRCSTSCGAAGVTSR